MAKKIRQEQIVNLKENFQELSDKQIASIAFTGTTTKTLTITLESGQTITSTFTDLNTAYDALTASLLNAGTSTVPMTISAKVFVDYLNARLGSVMRYMGQKTNYTQLPSSGNKTGDVWNIVNAYPSQNVKAGDNVAWNGTAWDVLSGTIDTSSFLTEESDPKGVSEIEVTGDITKTITITLRDGSKITGSFHDNNTAYTTGTIEELEAGTGNIGRLWRANTLSDFVSSMIETLEIEVLQEEFTIVAGNISGGNVTLTLARPDVDRMKTLIFLNGVKQPYGAVTSISGATLTIQQSALPTPMVVGDDVEIFYINN